MAIFNIPARNDLPWYSFKITLTNVVYTLEFRYNPRMARWIMNVMDSSGNMLIAGVALLIARDLAGQFVEAGLPPGTFYALDNTGSLEQPTRYSFGVTHGLFYEDDT